MSRPILSVLTATMGRRTLARTVDTVRDMLKTIDHEHILMWDSKRCDSGDSGLLNPPDITTAKNPSLKVIVCDGLVYTGIEKQVSLLTLARGEYLCFVDDDCWWNVSERAALDDLLIQMSRTDADWGFWLRDLYDASGDFLGSDRFASIGHLEPSPRSVFEPIVDMNCLVMRRSILPAIMRVAMDNRHSYFLDRILYRFLVAEGFDGPVVKESSVVNYTVPDDLVVACRKYATRERV